MRRLKNRACFSHMRSLVLADSDHSVNDVFLAVGVGDVAAYRAVGKRVVAKQGYGHIEHLIDFKFDVNESFARFVLDVPYFRFLLAVFVREHYGRHRERFVVNPNDVFVVLMLVDGLIASEVESKVFLFAVRVDLTHSGEPVVVSVERIVSFVVVDDTHRAFVGGVHLAVEGYRAACFEEVLFAVQSVFERAVLISCKGHNAVCERGYALESYIDCKFAVFAFGESFCVRFAVHKIVFDFILAVFGLAVAVVVHELRSDVRFLFGNEVAPTVDFVFLFVVPNED